MTMNKFLRFLCLALYLCALLAIMVDLPMQAGPWVQLLALLVLMAHALETVVAFKAVKAYPGPLYQSIVLSLLFGLLHWLPLSKAAKHGPAGR